MTTWTFDTPVGDLGLSHTYAAVDDGTALITAAPFGPGAPHLFGRSDGFDETGLGLTNSPSHDGEITHGSFVQLDLSAVAATHTGDLQFAASSTGGGDVWHLYAGNVAGTLGASLQTGDNNDLVDLGSGILGVYQYLNVTSDAGPTGNGTTLLHRIDASLTAIPEPASSVLWIVVAVAFFALAYWRQRPE